MGCATFGKSNLQVSGWGGSSLTVSINVTNILDETCNLSVLCVLLDKDVRAPKNSAVYPTGGKTMFPNMSAISKDTDIIEPGDTHR